MTHSDKKTSNAVYAFPKELLYSITKKIVSPIRKGESAIIVWFPHTGKSIFLNEIFKKTYVEEYLDPKKYIVIRLDMSLIFHTHFVSGLLQYLYCELVEYTKTKKEEFASYSDHEMLRELFHLIDELIKEGKHIIFITDEIESLTHELKSHLIQLLSNLVFRNRNNVHSILNVCNFDSLSLFERSDKSYSLIQNRIEMPLPTYEESTHFINILAQRWKIQLTQKNMQVLSEFFGNNLLTKTSLRKLKEQPNISVEEIHQDAEILYKMNIYDHLLGSHEKEVLKKVMFKLENFSKEDKSVLSYFERLQVIRKHGRKWIITLPILSHLVKNSNKDMTIYTDKDHHLFLGGHSLDHVLTPNEYKTLVLLYEKRGYVVQREELAKRIWGEVYLDKYSDWAIDKTVSRIRKKLDSLGFNKQMIHIVKGKGYKLQTYNHGT